MSTLRVRFIALLALVTATACAEDRKDAGPLSPDARSGEDVALASQGGDGSSGRRQIAIRDDCDPRDPAWAPTGGCLLRRGDVTFAEFAAENNSPLAASVVGHQAWRNDPTYLKIEEGETVRVRNEGGRFHTFTEVAAFGGGKIPSPALNKGLVTAPECPGSTDIPPGGRMQVSGLAAGNHRFQCCLHPWMRALIKVKADRDHGGH
ncbi:MAG: cupredoxin domain-containing protein [Gemmatimonadaceae bacterium]